MTSRSPLYADIPFIHLLRAIAVSLVLYDHLAGTYLQKWKATIEWMPRTWLQTYVFSPLGIIQSAGFIGVALFFLVSGYIITHTALSESRREFLVKRVFRIYPPLIVSVIVCLICGPWIKLAIPPVSDILLNFTLLNYVISPQVILQRVAWSLIIEVEFYLLTLVFLTTLKRSPSLHILLQSVLVGTCLLYCRDFGDNFFLFCAGFAYVPYLMVGQLLYFVQRKRMSAVMFVLLLWLQFGLIQWGVRTIHTQFLPADNSYLINFTFAFALFVVASLSGMKALQGFPKRIAEMSYSIYLLHGCIGIALLNVLTPRIGFDLSLVMALTISLAAAYLSYQFIEKPSQRLARSLLATSQKIPAGTTSLT